MKDSHVVKQTTRIDRYLVKLERLPRSMYTKAQAAQYEISFKATIDEAISCIGQSAHDNAPRIASLFRAEIDNYQITSIATNVRPYLEQLFNRLVESNELHYKRRGIVPKDSGQSRKYGKSNANFWVSNAMI